LIVPLLVVNLLQLGVGWNVLRVLAEDLEKLFLRLLEESVLDEDLGLREMLADEFIVFRLLAPFVGLFLHVLDHALRARRDLLVHRVAAGSDLLGSALGPGGRLLLQIQSALLDVWNTRRRGRGGGADPAWRGARRPRLARGDA